MIKTRSECESDNELISELFQNHYAPMMKDIDSLNTRSSNLIFTSYLSQEQK